MTQSRSALMHRSRSVTAGLMALSLLLGAVAVLAGDRPLPAEAADGGACEVGGGAASTSQLKVEPSHGSVFYIDSGQGQQVDAAYVGYRVTDTSNAARSNLWVQVDMFDGGVVELADPSDSRYRLKDIAALGTSTAFFLLKAPRPTKDAQAHRVRVFDGDPRLSSTVLYTCTFTFSQVRETIKAAANKVDGMSVAKVERLGGTLTVTVTGQTGIIGSGTSSPDGEVIWFTPAARSAWPSASLVLESTRIEFATSRTFNNPPANQQAGTFDDVLVFRQPRTTLSPARSRYSYRATYTFRIRGPVPSGISAIPIAQISSGTQIKHTDVASVTSQSASTVVLATPIELNVTKDALTSVVTTDGVSEFTFRITATSTGGAVNLDQIVDEADASLAFKAGSALWNGGAIADPVKSGGQFFFQGPFSVLAGGSRTLEYKMTRTCVDAGAIDVKNRAWGLIGNQVVGNTATSTLSGVQLTSTECPPTAVVVGPNDAPQPPVPVTQPASSVAETTATLNGSVNPTGVARTVTFEWGTDPTLATSTVVSLPDSGTGSAFTGVSTALTGLTAGTTYRFRVTIGGVKGEIRTFTTLPAVTPPSVVTDAVTSIVGGSGSNGSAVLNGTFSSNGTAGGATPAFRFGRTTSTDVDVSVACAAAVYGADTIIKEDISETDTPNLQNVLLESFFPSELSMEIDGLITDATYCVEAVITSAGPTRTVGSPRRFVVSGSASVRIFFDGNGATGGSEPAAQDGTTGTPITLRNNTGGLVRGGFVFGGWNTAPDGSGTDYDAGGAFTPSAEQTLYARWVPLRSVTYNGNGNTSGTVPATVSVASGGPVTAAGNSGALARTGFTFDGWQTTPSAGTRYAPGAPFNVVTDVILYARWNAEAVPPEDAPAPVEPAAGPTPTPPAPVGPSTLPRPRPQPPVPAGGPTPAPVAPPVVVRPGPIVVTPTPPSPEPTPSAPPALPGVSRFFPPSAPQAGSAPADRFGGATVDVGSGVAPLNAADGIAPAGDSTQGTRSVAEMATERLGGFDPSRGIRIEVLGARTGARFVLSDVSGVDGAALARAIETSIVSQVADFAAVRDVRPAAAPVIPAVWTPEVRTGVDEFFAAAGLSAPSALGDLDVSGVRTWLQVRMDANTYLPGSTVYLVVTSSPIVFGSATVARDGTVEVDGTMPVELLGAGEHRVRLVGIRSLDGVSVDSAGEVQLTAATMAEIERFDLGTQATVAVIGANPAGGGHVALRVVPLEPIAPWWTLWIVLVGFLGVAVARRRGRVANVRQRGLGIGALVLAALPAVVLGWRSTVTEVTWWGIGLTLMAMLLVLVVRPSGDASRDPASSPVMAR
jgi:uncharacterized repeat protein (TIGR02543 family)